MKLESILVAFFLFLITSTAFAEGEIGTGYDLYHNIKLMDNPQSPNEIMTAALTAGYLSGYVDGLVLMQTTIFNAIFPVELSEEERAKLSKMINFHRLNIPAGGLAVGQVILIYKKWAEKHPEELNGTARACILLSLIKAYGWK